MITRVSNDEALVMRLASLRLSKKEEGNMQVQCKYLLVVFKLRNIADLIVNISQNVTLKLAIYYRVKVDRFQCFLRPCKNH